MRDLIGGKWSDAVLWSMIAFFGLWITISLLHGLYDIGVFLIKHWRARSLCYAGDHDITHLTYKGMPYVCCKRRHCGYSEWEDL